MASNGRKYYGQIYNNSNLEYKQAQRYYTKLKNSMIDLIQQNLLQKLGKEAGSAIDQYATEIMNIIHTPPQDTNDNSSMRTTALQKLDQAFADATLAASQVDASTKKVLIDIFQEVKKDMQEYENQQKIKEKKPDYEIQNYTRSFLGRVDTKLKQRGYGEGWLANRRTAYSQQPTDSSEVTAQLSSYYLREFINQIQKNTISVGKEKFIQALRGYYWEEARTNAINNGLDQVLSKINSSSGKKVQKDIHQVAVDFGGKNTEQDIIFDLSFGIPNNIKITAEGLSKVDIKKEDIEKILSKEMISYGAQVKSWLPNSSGGWIYDVLPIGSRAGLYNKFMKQHDYPINQITASMAYLGQEDNIKEALGETNVMFIDGKSHYWMDEFIDRFRTAKYYLSFDYKKNKEEKDRTATSDVILYQWYKHHKNKSKNNQKRKKS